MSINWRLDVEPAPAIVVLPPGAASLDEAHAAIELWEHYSGKTLDPTQRLVVEVMMAETVEGRWAAKTTGRAMPRQNGKGDEIEVVELWGLVQRGEAILHTIHDAVLLASQAQQRLLGILEHKDLRGRVKRKWLGTGQQMVEMRNGGIIWYRTRTGGGGRGVDDISRLVVDEAQHATDEQVAAVSPTLLANPNPQMNVMGTSGLAGRSDWWWSVRRRALSPDPGDFGFVEHSAESVQLMSDGRVVQGVVDVEDRDGWVRANPAVSAPRGGDVMAFLEEQKLRLSAADFAREHLGVWDPPPGRAGSVLDLDVWAALVDMEDQRPKPVAFAVEVSTDRRWSQVGMAGVRADGRFHVQVVQSGKGTGWVADRVRELVSKWSPLAVALDPSGPAGSLLPALTEARVDVETLGAREVAQACGMFADAVAGITDGEESEPWVRHPGQQVLDVAVAAAGQKPVSGAWVFESLDGSTDISPLRAVTLAMFVLAREHAKKPKRTGVVVGIK